MAFIRIDLAQPIEQSARRRASSSAFNIASLKDAARDPLAVSVCIVAFLTLCFAAYLDHSANQRVSTLEVSEASGVRDSSKFALDLKSAQALSKKRDSIATRIRLVESIDRNRYAFVHVMDQAAANLGPNMWITSMSTSALDTASGTIAFSMTGYAPSTASVSNYVQQLEMSAFVANVATRGTSHVTVNKQDLIEFTIVGSSERPDNSFLETETLQPDGSRTLSTNSKLAMSAMAATQQAAAPMGSVPTSSALAPVIIEHPIPSNASHANNAPQEAALVRGTAAQRHK